MPAFLGSDGPASARQPSSRMVVMFDLDDVVKPLSDINSEHTVSTSPFAHDRFGAEVAHACTKSADGGAVAWRYEGQRRAALCADGDSLRSPGVALGNRSIAVVLATRTQVLDRVRARIGKS
ncbi:MAG: hypothetical protein RL701_5077 [Pseudomonadota bacterium]